MPSLRSGNSEWLNSALAIAPPPRSEAHRDDMRVERVPAPSLASIRTAKWTLGGFPRLDGRVRAARGRHPPFRKPLILRRFWRVDGPGGLLFLNDKKRMERGRGESGRGEFNVR